MVCEGLLLCGCLLVSGRVGGWSRGQHLLSREVYLHALTSCGDDGFQGQSIAPTLLLGKVLLTYWLRGKGIAWATGPMALQTMFESLLNGVRTVATPV